MSPAQERAARDAAPAAPAAEAERLFQTALGHHGRQELADALALYQRILVLAPQHFGSLNGIGHIALLQGRFADAATSFRQATGLDPNYAPAHNHLGLALQRLGRPGEAAASYQQAIACRPDFIEARFNLGNLLLELSRLDHAALAYRELLALTPDHAGAHVNLGNALRRMGRFDEAAAAYRQALRCDPSLHPVYFSLATALARAGDREQAIECYRDYLARDPDDLYGARFGLAFLGAGALPEGTPRQHLDHVYAGRAAGWGESGRSDTGYQGARLVEAGVARALGTTDDLAILDAGCGTGLVGRLLRPRARSLVGVDLSAAMLQKAAASGIYDRLEQADLVAFLAGNPRCCDLIVSAATLIHFNDLTPVFTAAAAALRDDGRFVFTVFPHEGDGVGVTPFQCFAHNPLYVAARAAEAGFIVEGQEMAVHEYHHDRPVMGLLVTLRRGGDASLNRA
jgi:predicted TPR repeat methyltransferase